MSISRSVAISLLAFAYCIIYYLLSYALSILDPFFLSRYIKEEESREFQPFIARSPHNIFIFESAENPSSIQTRSTRENLTLDIIQPPDYHDLSISPASLPASSLLTAEDVILCQNDTIIFELFGSALTQTVQSDSSAIPCLQSLATLKHSTNYVSNRREIYHQLPLQADRLRYELKIVEHFTVPLKSQTYRVEVESQTGSCYQQPANLTHSIRFVADDKFSSQRLKAFRLFYLIIMHENDIRPKQPRATIAAPHTSPASSSSTTATVDAIISEQMKQKDSSSSFVKQSTGTIEANALPSFPDSETTAFTSTATKAAIKSYAFPRTDSRISTSVRTKAGDSVFLAESLLVFPKVVSIVDPVSDAVLRNLRSMNVTIALPITFYTLSDAMQIVMEVNDLRYDVTQHLLQIQPPNDLLEKDLENWQAFYSSSSLSAAKRQQYPQRQRMGAEGLEIGSMKRFMTRSLSSASSYSRYFMFRYLYLVWIQLQDIPVGVYHVSVKAFLRPATSTANNTKISSSSSSSELLGFDSVRFEIR